jgi:hypothetical protein
MESNAIVTVPKLLFSVTNNVVSPGNVIAFIELAEIVTGVGLFHINITIEPEIF